MAYQDTVMIDLKAIIVSYQLKNSASTLRSLHEWNARFKWP